MPIVDDIGQQLKEANRSLNELSDFLLHTESYWSTFKRWTNAGNTLNVDNVATGSSVDQVQLTALTDRYRSDYVLVFAFQHLISTFEVFFFDLLKAILVNNPIQLSQDRQYRVREIVVHPDRDGLVQFFAERELMDLAYKRPRDWFDFLNRLVNTGCPAPDEIDAFSEMKACRDILIHNAGLANAVYLEKAGGMARWKAGEQIAIEPPYFSDCWQLAKKIINDFAGTAQKKLASV